MSKSVSSEIVLELIRLIAQPSFKRESHEIQLVLPWLKKRSQLLQHQENSVLADIVKNCTFLETHHDDVIIRQGERGDSYFEEFCFYVLLRGSVSVYIDPKMTGENLEELASRHGKDTKKKKEEETPKPPESEFSELSDTSKTDEEAQQRPEAEKESKQEEDNEADEVPHRKKLKSFVPVDRAKFGRHIVTYGVGDAFGEIALVHKDSFRNATIVSDDDADLMVIDQDLFDRSLRAEQEAKFQEIRDFIEGHPFFTQMTAKFKKLLEMSLRKETYIFDTNIIKQGDPLIGLHFIISGGAQITIEPKKHKQQYLDMWPFEAGVDTLSIEFEHLRELRRAAILRKYEDPSVWETMPEDLMIKRNEGYAAIEKHMQEKKISLCTVQAKEVLGDVEILLGLSTYMQTVRCTANTECFVLDTKNFERLVGKKSNAQTTDIMRSYVIAKLSTRMNMRHADLIPLLGYLHQKLTEQTLPPQKKIEPFKTTKALPDTDEEMQHLLQYFREGRDVMLIKPGVPGLVYYKELMHQKAENRALQRKTSKPGENIKLGSVYKSRTKRKPRSMLQIRESLRQMMENELIEMENKKMQKKLKNRQATEPNTGRTSQTVPTPRSLASHGTPEAKMPDECKAVKNAKPSLSLATNEPLKTRRYINLSPSNVENDVSNTENDITVQKPVLITEIPKENKDNHQSLPAIREEKTQEEIVLNTSNNVPKVTGDTRKSDTHMDITRERSSDSSFKDEIPSKIERSSDIKLNLFPESKDKAHIITPKSKKRKSPLQKSVSPKPNTVSPKPDSVPPQINSTSSTPSLTSPKTKSNGVISQVSQVKTNVPKLPAIGGEQEASHVNSELNDMNISDSYKGNDMTSEYPRQKEESLPDHWQTSMKVVNERIQNRLLNHSLDAPNGLRRDYDTSEGSMRSLESRIQAFHIKYGEGHKTKNLPRLRRYKLDAIEDKVLEKPKPGGRVWIKKRMCKFANTEYIVKDHQHVHYHMVENIPPFNNVNKTKAVMQSLLDSRQYGDDSDYFEESKRKSITVENS